MSRLQKDFYLQPATTVAPDLIGKILCRQTVNGILRRMITETECYFGSEDTACHAKRGITPANKIMFSSGGVCYVYLCYGIHYLFNVVTGKEGHGEGVLIRGVEGIKGPGLVSKYFDIDKNFYGCDLCYSDVIWIEDSGQKSEYIATKRIGIDYAEKTDRDRLWRYVAINGKSDKN